MISDGIVGSRLFWNRRKIKKLTYDVVDKNILIVKHCIYMISIRNRNHDRDFVSICLFAFVVQTTVSVACMLVSMTSTFYILQFILWSTL